VVTLTVIRRHMVHVLMAISLIAISADDF